MTDSDTVVVSPDFLPELKRLPDDVLSMAAAVAEVRLLLYATVSMIGG